MLIKVHECELFMSIPITHVYKGLYLSKCFEIVINLFHLVNILV